jgi:ribosomal protein S18 acetylase RimI-like enzyme
MRMYWEADGHDLSRDNLVVVAQDGRLAAYADFETWDPFDVSELFYAVHPDYIDAGLEEPILDWGDARARESAQQAAPDRQVKLEMSVWATNVRDAERLVERGFRFQRAWNRMRIDMDANVPLPKPTVPAGIIFRTLDLDLEGDVEAVHQAWEDAQRDEWGFSSLTAQEWNYYLVERELDFDPTLWFLAIDDANQEIVGYVLGRWERPGESDVGQVRYLGVRRPWRRRGIAQALLLQAFGEFQRRGRLAVSLSVDSVSPTGAHLLYERVGMRTERRSHVYEKVVRDAVIAEDVETP